mmetsp:Transcript_21861/g.31735  ORF Transcript_21861/g.31735 Transcript_21861/m.31735 type:complete len:216 (+) Transcript_21861:214-861(+)
MRRDPGPTRGPPVLRQGRGEGSHPAEAPGQQGQAQEAGRPFRRGPEGDRPDGVRDQRPLRADEGRGHEHPEAGRAQADQDDGGAGGGDPGGGGGHGRGRGGRAGRRRGRGRGQRGRGPHLQPAEPAARLGREADPVLAVQAARAGRRVQVRDLRGLQLHGPPGVRPALPGVAARARHAVPGHPEHEALPRHHADRGRDGAVRQDQGPAGRRDVER